MKDTVFKDAKGNNLLGTLSAPSGAKTMVIMSHGFTSSKESKFYVDCERELNALGIGTFRYDSYGHGPLYCKDSKYGVTADVTLTKSVASLEAAIKYVRDSGDYRIILMGSSYGGLLSLVVAAKDPGIVALVLKSPVIQPLALWNERVGVSGMAKWQQSGVLHYDDLGEKYDLNYGFLEDIKNFDVSAFIKQIKCPIFVVHGDADTVVSIKYTYSFVEESGAELHVVKNAHHGYSTPDQHREMKESLMQFIVNHI